MFSMKERLICSAAGAWSLKTQRKRGLCAMERFRWAIYDHPPKNHATLCTRKLRRTGERSAKGKDAAPSFITFSLRGEAFSRTMRRIQSRDPDFTPPLLTRSIRSRRYNLSNGAHVRLLQTLHHLLNSSRVCREASSTREQKCLVTAPGRTSRQPPVSRFTLWALNERSWCSVSLLHVSAFQKNTSHRAIWYPPPPPSAEYFRFRQI